MKLLLPSAIIAVAFLAFGSSGFANKGDAGVVKERTQMMKSMAQAVRRIAPMAKGERAIDGVTLRSSAIVIANHGGDLVRLFPKAVEALKAKPNRKFGPIWRVLIAGPSP